MAEHGRPTQSGHEDIAHELIATPCNLCSAYLERPSRDDPRPECAELWPLSRPGERVPVVGASDEADCLQRARARPWTKAILEAWEAGEQVTDRQYLKLREHAETGEAH